MTILYRDEIFLRHETGGHPERPARLEAIHQRILETGLAGQCQAGMAKEIPVDDLLQLHSPRQIQRVKEVAESGGGFLDADTILSSDSYEAARQAIVVCSSAVDDVLQGKDNNALCLVRPPGHHANQVRSMGFCLFNNIALAACYARKVHEVNRILIVDWDVHHGNGTQDIFFEDGNVTFFSIHRFGFGFYPGTGDEDEIGLGPGLGYTINLPISYGISRQEYQSQFRGALAKAADKAKPELILLSAGFDAHAADPIGSLGLEAEDFAEMTDEILQVANTHSHGRLVSCLEGGYNLKALADSVQAHLEQLLKH